MVLFFCALSSFCLAEPSGGNSLGLRVRVIEHGQERNGVWIPSADTPAGMSSGSLLINGRRNSTQLADRVEFSGTADTAFGRQINGLNFFIQNYESPGIHFGVPRSEGTQEMIEVQDITVNLDRNSISATVYFRDGQGKFPSFDLIKPIERPKSTERLAIRSSINGNDGKPMMVPVEVVRFNDNGWAVVVAQNHLKNGRSYFPAEIIPIYVEIGALVEAPNAALYAKWEAEFEAFEANLGRKVRGQVTNSTQLPEHLKKPTGVQYEAGAPIAVPRNGYTRQGAIDILKQYAPAAFTYDNQHFVHTVLQAWTNRNILRGSRLAEAVARSAAPSKPCNPEHLEALTK